MNEDTYMEKDFGYVEGYGDLTDGGGGTGPCYVPVIIGRPTDSTSFF